MIYNVLLISAVQQSGSDMCVCVGGDNCIILEWANNITDICHFSEHHFFFLTWWQSVCINFFHCVTFIQFQVFLGIKEETAVHLNCVEREQ